MLILKSIKYKSLQLLLLVVVIISSCNKSELSEESTLPVKNKSSITLVNNHYKIDSNVILFDLNKSKLLNGLSKEKLTEKKTVVEIPGFIMDFLNKTQENGKFEMAGKGNIWKQKSSKIGVLLPMKVYDEFLQDSILILTSCNFNLPDKQMVYFGIGENYALLSYYSANFSNSQQAAIFQFKNEKIVDFWFTQNKKLGETKDALINSLKNTSTRSGGC